MRLRFQQLVLASLTPLGLSCLTATPGTVASDTPNDTKGVEDEVSETELADPGTDVCSPNDYKGCCGSAVCWFDSCGIQGIKTSDCANGCAEGHCKECLPSCGGKDCGDDGCGGTCGSCSTGMHCQSGHCACEANDHEACAEGDVYWFDSCGVKGSLSRTCQCGCTASSCECCPNWKCSDWSKCSCNSVQARTCTDLSACGTVKGKPTETQSCNHCGNGACDCEESNETCSGDCPLGTPYFQCLDDGRCKEALGPGAYCNLAFPGGQCVGCTEASPSPQCGSLSQGGLAFVCRNISENRCLYQCPCPDWLSCNADVCALKECTSDGDCAPFKCREIAPGGKKYCLPPL
jgi:hypothetical protein